MIAETEAHRRKQFVLETGHWHIVFLSSIGAELIKPHRWGWRVFEVPGVEPGVLPPRNCSHEALPFVEATAKAKLAGGIETQPGHDLAALSVMKVLVTAVILGFQSR